MAIFLQGAGCEVRIVFTDSKYRQNAPSEEKSIVNWESTNLAIDLIVL